MLYIDIAFVAFLILLNGIFAMSELAIVSSKKVHLRRLADEGRKSAKIALDLADDTGRFLPTVQIGITLIGVLSGAVSGAVLSEPFAEYLTRYIEDPYNAEIVAVSVIVVIITYFSLIIGELVPKELALRNPERLAMFVAPIIYGLSRITAPIVFLLDFSCKMVLRLIGARQKPKTTVTPEEVKSLIEEGTEFGLFHEAERDMISGVMLLSDKPIRAFMVPRMEVVAFDYEVSFNEARTVLMHSHYSRYPVKKGDEVVGILQTKEILNHILQDQIWDMDALMQPIKIFQDTKPTLAVIEYLRKSPIQMAAIVDEHNVFIGIVTLADLVQVITGELYVHDDAADTQQDGPWEFDARMLLEIAFKKIELTGLPNHDGYHTLAGFVLHRLRHIPKAGEHFTYRGFEFEVIKMEGVRIDKVRVKKIQS